MSLLMRVLAGISLATVILSANPSFAAYHHGGDTDSDVFLLVYPEAAGTKLDNCNLCHSGGEYLDSKGKKVSMGSCQWCHYTYGYDGSGNVEDTLNPYGKDYWERYNNSKDKQIALTEIAGVDSDGDGYLNSEEIATLRFPGDPKDDPSKVPAPYRIYSMADLLKMKQHTQLLLMNAHKSTDHYTQYTGVTMEELLKSAGALETATGVKVFAPDGWAQYHPLYSDPDPLMYHLIGTYPEAIFHYNEQADISIGTEGWCDYSSRFAFKRTDGKRIHNAHGLKTILAFLRDGKLLIPGELTAENKLDGEGPFRVVPPQKVPGPPDQSSRANDAENPLKWCWPFDAEADHNAGYSTRSATIIKVEPLPENTTDIDVLEAGWNLIDQRKIIVYGAIDPVPGILEKIDAITSLLNGLNPSSFKKESFKDVALTQLRIVKRMIESGSAQQALNKLQNGILKRFDGCSNGSSGADDWVSDCSIKQQIYEIIVLLQAGSEA